jgi:hypothetical protein
MTAALNQDEIANSLVKKGKSDAITKVFNAVGGAVAVKPHLEADKYRAQAAELRDELARLESQSPASPGLPNR